MEILKILASNSKRFIVYGIFKKWQNDDDRVVDKYNIFLNNFSLKQPFVLKITLDMFFDSGNSRMILKLP